MGQCLFLLCWLCVGTAALYVHSPLMLGDQDKLYFKELAYLIFGWKSCEVNHCLKSHTHTRTHTHTSKNTVSSLMMFYCSSQPLRWQSEGPVAKGVLPTKTRLNFYSTIQYNTTSSGNTKRWQIKYTHSW